MNGCYTFVRKFDLPVGNNESGLKQHQPFSRWQFHPEGWHAKLGNPQIADAILDRIIHDSYQILVDGKVSMRERHGIHNASNKGGSKNMSYDTRMKLNIIMNC